MPSFYNRRANDQELRVLLVSDVHCSLTNVHRLAELLTSRGEYVDMIWLAGDVTRLCEEDYEVPARFSASEGDMSAVLSALENIQCRVAYVPGAHDPSSTTELSPTHAAPKLTPHSCNVHGRCLRIAPELVLVGFGGRASEWDEPQLLLFESLLESSSSNTTQLAACGDPASPPSTSTPSPHADVSGGSGAMFRPELFRESPGKSQIISEGLQGLQGSEFCESGEDSPGEGGGDGGVCGGGVMGLLLNGSTRLGNDRVLPGDSVVLLTHSAPANRSSHGSGDAANAALGAAGGDGSEQLEDILLRRGGKEESTGYQGEES